VPYGTAFAKFSGPLFFAVGFLKLSGLNCLRISKSKLVQDNVLFFLQINKCMLTNGDYRIPGVLQRFGISYLVVASVEAFLMPREYPPLEQRGGCRFSRKNRAFNLY
jgi:hypothetical protein